MRYLDDKGNIAVIIGIIAVICIVGVVLFLAYMGYIPLLNLSNDDDGGIGDPLGSDYCGYTKGEIVGMFENLAGKNLNRDIGFSAISALNVRACGSNSRQPEEIIDVYRDMYADDWYILLDDDGGGVGYTYNFVVWGNSDNVFNATLFKSVLSGYGVTVNEWYNYNTVTITGYGTRSGYIAFMAWLRS